MHFFLAFESKVTLGQSISQVSNSEKNGLRWQVLLPEIQDDNNADVCLLESNFFRIPIQNIY